MPKSSSDNFLRGWCRQLRAALDEGGELAYEAAELIDEALTLIEPSGDAGDQMGLADRDGGEDPGEVDLATDAGHQQDDLPGMARMGRGMVDVPSPDHGSPGVPRGTGSGTSTFPGTLRRRVGYAT